MAEAVYGSGMAEPSDRGASIVVPALAGAIAAAVVVAVAWFALRGDDSDDVAAVASSTTAADGPATSPPPDSASSTTAPVDTTIESTDTTTIDDVPLSDLPAGAPDTFVAVTDDTFELVEVDSRTGEIVAELGSWGPGAGGGEPDQALQMVELAPDGTIFVDDCCEPAYGSTFLVTSSFDPTSTFSISGTRPELSPDGTRLARSALGSAISISDASGSELGTFGEPDFIGAVVSPLTWIDSSTLVVSSHEIGDDGNRLQVLDVSDPNAPIALVERFDPGRFHAAADVRADGNILVVVRRFDPATGSTESDDVVAEIIDPTTGETITDFDLPDDVYEVNYDASGRFVVTVRTNGQLDWYGAGQRGTLASGFISADW